MLGTVQKAVPILICHCFGPLLVLLSGKGLQLLQLFGAQMNPLSLKGGRCNLWGYRLRQGRWDVGADHHCYSGLLRFHMGNHTAAHNLLWPANSSSLVRPGQYDSGHAKCLIVPAQ